MCKNIFLILSTIVVLLTSCNNKATKPPYNLEQQSSAIISIPYEELGGVKTIPVKLNGITMTMIYDTGCSGIHLSLNEVQTLVKNGKLDIDDILDASYTTIADGSIVENGTINIKRIEMVSCLKTKKQVSLLIRMLRYYLAMLSLMSLHQLKLTIYLKL